MVIVTGYFDAAAYFTGMFSPLSVLIIHMISNKLEYIAPVKTSSY